MAILGAEENRKIYPEAGQDGEELDALLPVGGDARDHVAGPASEVAADRTVFEEYWDSGLEEVRIDPVIRDRLRRLVAPRLFPALVRVPLAGFHRFVTTGSLPPRFREATGLTWSGRDQRRFDRLARIAGAVAGRLPLPLRRFPVNL